MVAHQLPKLRVASSILVYRHIHQKQRTMTEINVFDSNGKIVFRSVEPRLMTEEQVNKELDKWCVNASKHRVQIIYNTK